MVGVTSRLVHQKGFDIVVRAWYDLLQRPIRMVVLGTGEPDVQDGFRALAARAPDRFAVHFAYDNALAHKIVAGSDMFLMPSRFEPCGLTQMYSLRYGTVPIVRSTGGLVDTVEPWDPATGSGTGFRFDARRRHRAPVGASTRRWPRMPTRARGRSSCGTGWPATSPGSGRRASTRASTAGPGRKPSPV